MSRIDEGFQVEFGCGHTMVYDRNSQHGTPQIGQPGTCRQCATPELFLGVDRIVVGIRQCWTETTTQVHFTDPREQR